MWYYEYPPTDNLEALPFYLHSIGLHEYQPEIQRPEGYPYDQFFYSEQGSGELDLGGRVYHLEGKSGFFIPAKQPHSYRPMEDKWDIRWFVPCGRELPAIYRFLNIRPGGYTLQNTEALDRIMNKMHFELIKDRRTGNVVASACIMEFLVEYARQVQSLSVEEMKIGEMKGPYEKNMAVLEHYIDQHFGAPIGMEELCSLIHVTPQHLCRIFKQCSGMRPMEYIRHRRIEVAKALLEGTDTPISEIAAICGFENNNYFWKSFRQIVKMTPKEYRESTSRECR